MIKINDEWFVTVDKYCYILNRNYEKNGEKLSESVSYHTNLQGLIKSIIKRKLKLSNAKNFKALQESMENIYNEIKQCEDLNVSVLRSAGHHIEVVCIEKLANWLVQWNQEENWNVKVIESTTDTDPFEFL